MGCCGGQSVAGVYGGNSFVGKTLSLGTDTTVDAVRVQLRPSPTDGSAFEGGVFVITFSDEKSYCLRQGGSDVVATSDDFRIASANALSQRWRVDVDALERAFISILTPDGSTVTNAIHITRIDKVELEASASLGGGGGQQQQ